MHFLIDGAFYFWIVRLAASDKEAASAKGECEGGSRRPRAGKLPIAQTQGGSDEAQAIEDHDARSRLLRRGRARRAVHFRQRPRTRVDALLDLLRRSRCDESH